MPGLLIKDLLAEDYCDSPLVWEKTMGDAYLLRNNPVYKWLRNKVSDANLVPDAKRFSAFIVNPYEEMRFKRSVPVLHNRKTYVSLSEANLFVDDLRCLNPQPAATVYSSSWLWYKLEFSKTISEPLGFFLANIMAHLTQLAVRNVAKSDSMHSCIVDQIEVKPRFLGSGADMRKKSPTDWVEMLSALIESCLTPIADFPADTEVSPRLPQFSKWDVKILAMYSGLEFRDLCHQYFDLLRSPDNVFRTEISKLYNLCR